jgi:hypothetical protein
MLQCGSRVDVSPGGESVLFCVVGNETCPLKGMESFSHPHTYIINALISQNHCPVINPSARTLQNVRNWPQTMFAMPGVAHRR